MTDKKNIPFLIDLLDDPDHEIRDRVIIELESFNEDLEPNLLEFKISLDIERKLILNRIIEKIDREWLRRRWKILIALPDSLAKLEQALTIIADFQNGRFSGTKVSNLLDQLAEECRKEYRHGDPFELSSFLFQQKKLKGAEKDYYNPLNSNLVYVIQSGQGLPISLACVFMLVGNRLGLQIDGCNFPGHFLARFKHEDEIVLVDCFNGGRFIYEEDLKLIEKDYHKSILDAAYTELDFNLMLHRILTNLVNAYKRNGDEENAAYFQELSDSVLTI